MENIAGYYWFYDPVLSLPVWDSVSVDWIAVSLDYWINGQNKIFTALFERAESKGILNVLKGKCYDIMHASEWTK